VTGQALPSELVADIKKRLDEIQKKAAKATQEVGLARETITAGEPYWQALDQRFKTGRPDSVLTSGYTVLTSLQEQAKAIDEQTNVLASQVHGIAINTGIYADVTASTANVSGVEILWNPEPLNRLRYSFNSHDEYAEKIKHIDPSLSISFSGIKETYLGGSPDRMRQALFECRQTVDHLFDCLVPDDSEVTKQPWWSPEDPKKPNMVTRAQRLRFAAEKHVRNHNQRQVLVDGTQHMNEVYNKLQRLHKRGPINEDKARDTILEMLSIIRAWVDSITETVS